MRREPRRALFAVTLFIALPAFAEEPMKLPPEHMEQGVRMPCVECTVLYPGKYKGDACPVCHGQHEFFRPARMMSPDLAREEFNRAAGQCVELERDTRKHLPALDTAQKLKALENLRVCRFHLLEDAVIYNIGKTEMYADDVRALDREIAALQPPAAGDNKMDASGSAWRGSYIMRFDPDGGFHRHGFNIEAIVSGEVRGVVLIDRGIGPQARVPRPDESAHLVPFTAKYEPETGHLVFAAQTGVLNVLIFQFDLTWCRAPGAPACRKLNPDDPEPEWFGKVALRHEGEGDKTAAITLTVAAHHEPGEPQMPWPPWTDLREVNAKGR